MLGRFMDWIDAITGYDRESARVLFVVVVINVAFVALLLWPTVKEQVFGPDCDATCRAVVEQYIEDNPSYFEPKPTVDVEEIIDEVLNDP